MTSANENPETQETQDIPAASTAPNSTEEFFPDTDKESESGGDPSDTPREQAWQQQQQASQTYFDETQTFGYPNSAAPTATSGYKTAYKKGPNMGAIIWGVVALVVAASLIAWFLLPGLFVTTNMWAVLLSAAFAAIGLSLVVGAVITSLTGRRSKGETTPPVI